MSLAGLPASPGRAVAGRGRRAARPESGAAAVAHEPLVRGSTTVAQSAFRTVRRHDVSSVAADDAPRDGEPEPAASGVAAARYLEAHEGLEHPLGWAR